MISSACKYNEHTLCPVHGRVRFPSGKVIGCKCSCHPPKIVEKKVKYDEDED